MSYTTRCPACGTTFRVVPDQLKISDGWVRCGYCSDVFDATIHLQDWPAQQVAPAPAGSPAGAAPVPVSAPGDTAVDEASGPVAEPEPEDAGWQDGEFLADLHRYAQRARGTEAEADPDTAPPPAPTRAEMPPASPGSERAALMAPMPASAAPVPDADADRTVAPPADPDPTDAAVPLRGDEAPGLQAPPVLPGFVVQARRRAFWSSPGVRALLLVLVLVLTGLLMSQWVWHERDQVAARWPAARPLLQSACAMAGCEIAPVRRIDDVVIDSSHLARRLGSFYVFDLVLRNKADVPVAMPALELSLTGPRNELLARRVFLPQELPGTPVVVPARGSLDLALSLSISLAEASVMSGYQAVLFYP